MLKDAAKTLYVSPLGNDAWSGALAQPNAVGTDGPFATLVGARDAIRAMRKADGLSQAVTVLVRGGLYTLSTPLVFEEQDSGTAECPISYKAFPGETPIISGGRRISATWEPYQGEIMVCHVPEAQGRQWTFRQLFVNGKRQTRAKLPDQGFYWIQECIDDTSFQFAPGDICNWSNLNDAEALVYHSWDESRLIISDVDEGANTVRFTGAPEPSHPFGWRIKNRYYVENVLEALTRPGEWYLDYDSGKLYWWATEDLSQAEIVAPVQTQLVRFEGDVSADRFVSHVAFEGLQFAYTDWTLSATGYPGCGDVGDIVEPSALNLEGARNCTVQGCQICHVGTYGLELAGYGNRIVDNDVFDTGSGGIVTRNFHPEPNTVSYNHVYDCGIVYPSAVGINIDEGGGIFSHNLVHNASHSGIYARHWPTDHQPRERRNQEQQLLIEYNEIYDIVAPINDGAGIFVRDSNMILRNNLIHDCYSFGDGTPGWGIYLGCESRNSRVYNNIVYRTREGVHVWYSNRNITLENNIFVDGLKTQINYTNTEDRGHENIRFVRNIIAYGGDEASLYLVAGDRSLPVESDYNLIYHPTGGEMRVDRHDTVKGWQAWRERGYDLHSLLADPLFVDPENEDYGLQPDSPALALGFKPIDMTTVGLRGHRRA